eukprot:15474531-Alexandrium_andersonii.AAC.1
MSQSKLKGCFGISARWVASEKQTHPGPASRGRPRGGGLGPVRFGGRPARLRRSKAIRGCPFGSSGGLCNRL